jgi:hypothetical protein
MNNIYWGAVDDEAFIMPPGSIAGDGRCEARQWGVPVEDIVVFGSLDGLRSWAQSVLDRLPPAHRASPLVTIDDARQWQWLQWSPVLGTTEEESRSWIPTVETVHDLMQAVAADPATAGWILGDGVDALWADLEDDNGDLITGVTLARPRHEIGIGEPLNNEDLIARTATTSVERANACLRVIADRVNQSY